MSEFSFTLPPETPVVTGSGIAFQAIKNAIQAWCVFGSRLPGDHVVWSGLRDSRGNPIPRPSGLYVSLGILGIKQPGFDDTSTYTVDDASNVMSQTVQGPRILVLSIKVFQGSPVGGDDIDALRILTDILTATDSDDVDQLLTLAKIAVGSYDDATNTPQGFNNAKQELLAASTVKLHIGSSISFTQPVGTGWIDNVVATGEVTSESGVETVTVSVTS